MLRKLLIVDDNEINRALLNKILSSDYEIIEADNGKKAIEILKQNNNISAVLLDIVMPVMDGHEVLYKIRSDESLAQIPVIVATGTTEEGAEVRALSLGANDFITKPYKPEIIKHRLWNTIKLCETAAFVNSIQRDKLTGLYNRETFFSKAEEMIAEHEAGYYVMACFDVENFKVINDQYGNAKGDEILRYISDVFKNGFEKAGGLCGRIMADNFAVLYPKSFMDSDEIAQIRIAVSKPACFVRPITYSIGRYIISDLSLSGSAMYDRASMAEASVKARFDVKIAQYDESMRENILREQEIINEMKSALEAGQFEIWLQPQYNHSSGALIGSEALVRWRHPKKGIIPPADFIPVFERNGFIYELDKNVWEQGCILLRKWLDADITPLPISVNVSRYDIFREDFYDTVTELVEKYNIPLKLFRLEITESAFAKSSQQIIDVVKRLINYGFTIEIDDFGSGYSSLNTLKDVPANVLKLDMRFLENDENSSRGGNILESIVRMAKWLGMPVIAEGVETKEQADYLTSIGCVYVQGYLYARPMPVFDYENLISCVNKEPKMSALETVETLDNIAFWNPKSLETLIFNSYVGGACIFEYYNGETELLRINEKYALEIGCGALTMEEALNIKPQDYMDEKNRNVLEANIQYAIKTDNEATCEVCLKGINGCDSVYLRTTVRVIAKTGNRMLFYCNVINVSAQREAEQKERETSEQLQAIMSNIRGGVSAATLTNGAVDYIFVNEAYYSMFGYTKAQFKDELKRGIIDIIHPEDLPTVLELSTHIPEGNKSFQLEYRVHKRDGSVMWVRSNCAICHMEGYESPVQLAVTTDITVEKASEQQILNSADQLRFLNETAHELLAQDDADIGINSVLRKILEYFDGDRTYVFEFNYMKQTSDNTYELCAKGITSEKNNLIDVPFEVMSFWFDAFEKNSFINIENVEALDESREDERRILSAQKISSLIAVPLWRDELLIGFIGVDNPRKQQSHVGHLQAIGDYIAVMLSRRDLNAKIENDNNVFLSFMNDTPGGFVRMRVFDDGKIVPIYANNGFCKIVGMSSDEVLNKYSESAMWGVHPDDLKIVENAVAEMLDTGEARSSQYRLLHGDGGYVWIMFFGRMTKSDTGEIFLNIYYTDLSEAEKTELSFREMLPVALNAMMASSTDLSFVKDKDLTYICCSRAFAVMVGLHDESQIRGKTDYDLFEKELADKYRADDRKVIESGKALVDYVESLPCEDGTFRYSSTSKYLLNDSSGNIIGIYGIGRDITENREAYARLKLLTDSIPGGLATYEMSPRGTRALYFSDGFFAFSGYTRKEYQQIVDVDPLALVFDEDRPIIEKTTSELLTNGGERANYIYRSHIKNGGYRWLNMRGTVSERREDTVIINAVQIDITEQKLVEEKLRIREEEYRLAIHHSGKLIYRYIHSDNTIIMPSDTSRLFGLHSKVKNMPESLIQSGSVAPESINDFTAFYKSIKDGAKKGSATIRRKINDGSYRWFEACFSTIYDDAGVPVSAVIMFEDITKERENYIGEALDRIRLTTALRTVYPVSISVNLSKGTYKVISGGKNLFIEDAEEGNFDDLVSAGAKRISAEYSQLFIDTFKCESLLGRLSRDKNSVRMEYRQKLSDNKQHWVESIALTVKNDYDSDVTGVVLCRVIDEQKSNEEKLQQMLALADEELSKERVYQKAMDTYTPTATVILGLESNELLHVGGTLVSELGYSAEDFEAIHKNYLKNFVFENDYGTAYRDVRLFSVQRPEVIEQEFRVYRKDGSLVWLYEKGTLVDMNGVQAYIIVLFDITHRKNIEEKLRISEEEIKLAMEQMGKMICVYDVTSQMLSMPEPYVNKHGYAASELKLPEQAENSGFFTEEGRENFIRFFEAILSGEKSGIVEVRIKCADGSWCWERGEFASVFDSNGNPIKAIVTVEDTTKNHSDEIKEELRRENERVLQIIAAHSNRLIYRYDIAAKTAYAKAEVAKKSGVPEVTENMPEFLIESGMILPESIEDFRKVFKEIHAGKREGYAKIRMRKNKDVPPRWMDLKYSVIYSNEHVPKSAVLSLLDITENHEKELAYDRYLQTIDENSAGEGVLIFLESDVTSGLTEKHGGVMLPESFPIAGRSRTEIIEHIAKCYIIEEERNKCREFFSREHLLTVFSDGVHSLSEEWGIIFPGGRPGYIRSELQMVQDPYSGHIKVYTLLRDITAEKRAALDVKKQAETDGMTGLYNKTKSEELIRKRLSRADGTPCALLICDLDNLKSINDSLGHDKGDDAICRFADMLRLQFRRTDIVGRAGGDEFIVFLDGAGNNDRLKNIMREFMRKLSSVRIGNNSNFILRGSIGIVISRIGEESYEELFKKADKALYHVKRNGKNDYAIYTPDMARSTYKYIGNNEARGSILKNNYLSNDELDCLLKAMSEIYSLVISVNLTQNTYYMLQHESYLTRSRLNCGVYDALIEEAAGAFHENDKESFINVFSRKNLLEAHSKGERIVSNISRQLGDDGVYRRIKTDVIFVESSGNDVLEITLARETEQLNTY